MQAKPVIISILVAVLLIGGALYLGGNTTSRSDTGRYDQTVERQPAQVLNATSTMENGTQYVDILARGGYSPRTTTAQAGVPTVIRVRTENTFDCSSALVIPALGFNGYLDRTGVKEIAVPADKAQGTLHGLCSMGMYTFDIVFQ